MSGFLIVERRHDFFCSSERCFGVHHNPLIGSVTSATLGAAFRLK